MKRLTEYFTESARTYDYRIKIAGELDKVAYEKFKASLDKFSVQSCSKPKKTPIQSDPVGFPGLKNQEINIFDAIFEYPASVEQIQQLAKLAGFDENSIVILSKDFNDSMNAEINARSAEEGKVRLETENYPENTKEQNDAKAAYADSYKAAAAEFANEAKTDFEVAGDAEPAATYTTDSKEGTQSPMSNIKRKSIGDMLK